MQVSRVTDGYHRAERRPDPIGPQQAIAAQFSGRQSENTRKGAAESFGRFKSRVDLRIDHTPAIGKRLEPVPQALPRHFEKRHSEMAAETATDGRRIKPQPGHILFAPASLRFGFKRVEKLPDGRFRFGGGL